MSLIDKLLGRNRATPPPAGGVAAAMPLGLRMGGRIRFDRMMYRVAPDALSAELPAGDQGIECYGHIDLGDGCVMHRFYLEDDAYLQVMTVGQSIESIKAFVFHETVNPPTLAAFREFVASHPHLGAGTIDYAGQRWSRVTSPDGGQKIPPMAFDEVLYRGVPPRRDDGLTHYAMVYARDVPQLDREELLLVTAEDSGPHQYCVTYAIGLDLSEADLDIT